MDNKVVVAIDGSNNALKALDYLAMLFARSDLEAHLLYVMPALPPLFDDPAMRRKARKQLEAMEKKNREMGEAILSDGSKRLENKGLAADRIHTHLEAKKLGPARDVCNFAGKNKAKAILVGARGRSRLEKFFTGSVSHNIIECSKTCPVWVVNGEVKSGKVLFAIDASENAMQAVTHGAHMLEDTAANITLFHTKRDLSRFIPKEVLKAAPDLEELWQTEAGEQVAPFMQKAMEKLKAANVSENRISTKIIHGTRSPADDILQFARKNGYGTIVMGRHGQSDKKDYAMGGITGKVLQDSANLAIWIC